MNWLHWWLPEFLISAAIWLWLAPAVGARVIARIAPKSDHSVMECLEFLVGFTVVSVLASFLVPFHKLGLVFLLVILLVLKLRDKNEPEFKIQIYDIVITLPILLCSLFYPTTYDTNVQSLQLSLFKDVWPMDWGARLDIHHGLTVLFSSWLGRTPIFNLLSVQGAFYALVTWRALLACWLLLRKKLNPAEIPILTVLFLGTLFYRKQMQVKASPIGGALSILVMFMVTSDVMNFPVLTGLIMAGSFYFGEYGAMILALTAPLLLFCKSELRGRFFAAIPWAILFCMPEVGRKVFIASGGNFLYSTVGVLICLILFLVLSGKEKYLALIPNSKNAAYVFFISTVILAVGAQCFYTLVGPEGNLVSLRHWTLGAHGVLFLATLVYFWKFRRTELVQGFLVFSAVQFTLFAAWHAGGPFVLLRNINPTQVWWNLMKNATMIFWPLVTTLFGAALIITIKESMKPIHGRVFAGLILAFFLLLQDPLTKNVGDGPFAPHSPRMSIIKGIQEMLWQVFERKHLSSITGNVVLSADALQEPEMVETVFDLQRHSPRKLNVCMEKISAGKGFTFDTEAYTFQYPAGADAFIDHHEPCNLELIPNGSSCANGSRLVMVGLASTLCSK